MFFHTHESSSFRQYLPENRIRSISECSHSKLGHWQRYRFSLTKLIKNIEEKLDYFIKKFPRRVEAGSCLQ